MEQAQALNQRILEILDTIKYSTTGYKMVSVDGKLSASNKIEKLIISEKIGLLNDIFTDGIGNLDDVCSKDDLTEQYHIKIVELNYQLNQL